jgi:PAS domain-containing protein
VIEAQTAQLASAIDRIRDIRRFAADTIENLPDAVIVTDLDEWITLANAGAMAALGDDLAGRQIEDVILSLGADLRQPKSRCPMAAPMKARAPLEHDNRQHSGWILRLVDITPIREAERTREDATAQP